MARTREWRRLRRTLLPRPKYTEPSPEKIILPSNDSAAPSSHQPTTRSASLLASLPSEILQDIFQYLLTETLWSRSIKAPFYSFLDLSSVFVATALWRNVCSQWTAVLRNLLFTIPAPRNGLLIRIDGLTLPAVRELFPHLSGILLNFGDPNDVLALESIYLLLSEAYSPHTPSTSAPRTSNAACLSHSPDLMNGPSAPSAFSNIVSALAFNPHTPDSVSRFNIPLQAACDAECYLHVLPFVLIPPPLPDEEEGGHHWRPDRLLRRRRIHPRIVTFIERQLFEWSRYQSTLILQLASLLPDVAHIEIPSFVYSTLSIPKVHIGPAAPAILAHQRVYLPPEAPIKILPASGVKTVYIITSPHALHGTFTRDCQARMPPGFRTQEEGEDWEHTLAVELENRIAAIVNDSYESEEGFAFPEGYFEGLEGWGLQGLECTEKFSSDRMLLKGLGGAGDAGVKRIHIIDDGRGGGGDLGRALKQLAASRANESLVSLTLDCGLERMRFKDFHFCELFADSGIFLNLRELDVALPSLCPKIFERHFPDKRGGKWHVKTYEGGCKPWIRLPGTLAGPLLPVDNASEDEDPWWDGRVRESKIFNIEKIWELVEVARERFSRPSLSGGWDVGLGIVSFRRQRFRLDPIVRSLEISPLGDRPEYVAVGWGDEDTAAVMSRRVLGEEEVETFLVAHAGIEHPRRLNL